MIRGPRTTHAAAPSGVDLEQMFEDPPATYSPTPFWWWSGGRLRGDRLRWQLERLAGGGVRNVIVINLAPAGPLWGAPVDDPPWFSDEWWSLFEETCRAARDLGVGVWFYDQIGAHAANVPGRLSALDPSLSGQVLERSVVDAEGPCVVACPDGATPIAGAAIPLDANGVACGEAVPAPLDDGRLVWNGRGKRHRVMLAYARPQGYDYLSPRGGAALIDAVHGEFERRLPQYLGDPIHGSWQDEMLRFGTWTDGFGEAFSRQHGYELTDHVAALWEGSGDDARTVRTHYHATRAALAESSFFRPLHEWHQRHGLLHGCDQQRPARAGHPLAGAQLYGDYMQTHRWMSAPGCDQAGDGKIHSSLAHLYDHPRASVLAFHTSGWGGTLEETFDWLLRWVRAGINLYVPHAVYYGTPGGWFEWAAPSTCWRQPYWRHYPTFATAVGRLCAVLAQGEHRCDLAVLYPTTTIHAHLAVDAPLRQLTPPDAEPPPLLRPALEAQDSYLDLVGRMDWKSTAVGVLDRDRRDFDVVDEPSVQRAVCEGGALHVAGERYSALVLPACRVVQAATASALVEFVLAGGTLVAIGALPDATAEHGTGDGAVRRLADLAAQGRIAIVATPGDVPGALSAVPRTVDAPVPTLLRRVGERHVLFVPAAFPGASVTHYGDEMEAADYDFDPARYANSMTITVRGVHGDPEMWDPFTGERTPLDSTPLREGSTDVGVELTIPFHGAPAALLVWGSPPRR